MKRLAMKKHSTFNIQQPTSKTAGVRAHWRFDVGCWLLDVFPFRPGCATLLALLAAVSLASAQTNKNIPGPTDYAAFSKFVTDRNIFDPSRQPHYTSSHTRTTTRTRTRASSSAPAFTLVGTMEYEKGMFAFFSGNSEELKKALQASQKIAGYTVTDISYGRVTLESADKKQKLELKVGDVMREETGGWQLEGQGEVPAGSSSSGSTAGVPTESSSTSNGEPAEPASASAPNDILKRLMEKREQESK